MNANQALKSKDKGRRGSGKQKRRASSGKGIIEDMWTGMSVVRCVRHAGHKTSQSLYGNNGRRVYVEQKKTGETKSEGTYPRFPRLKVVLLLALLDVLGQPLQTLEETLSGCRTAVCASDITSPCRADRGTYLG